MTHPTPREARRRRPDSNPWHWLLLVLVVLPLMTPLFNRVEPRLFGFPFFYWIQLAMVFVVMATLTFITIITGPRR
jgi:hypothetical protein